MKVRYTERAVADAVRIREYIAAENRSAAERVANRIQAAAESLAIFPGRGRSGRSPGTRELLIAGTPYALAYRVIGDTAYILHVLDLRRGTTEGDGDDVAD